MITEFAEAIEALAPRYNVKLQPDVTTRLCSYYALVLKWNPRLHLVGPCTAAEFATRHVLESMVALDYLAPNARIADLGSGAGLPIIPCLIARNDLHATLIEASQKKAVFLREALRETNLAAQAEVVSSRFEDTEAPEVEVVTCRAIERFSDRLPEILQWAPRNSSLLLFGGPSIAETLEALRLSYDPVRLPFSNQRFMFVVAPRTE